MERNGRVKKTYNPCIVIDRILQGRYPYFSSFLEAVIYLLEGGYKISFIRILKTRFFLPDPASDENLVCVANIRDIMQLLEQDPDMSLRLFKKVDDEFTDVYTGPFLRYCVAIYKELGTPSAKETFLELMGSSGHKILKHIQLERLFDE